MHVLSVRNVNAALQRGVHLIETEGVRRDSRNGPVKVIPEPVTTVYRKPMERVLFAAERDANPFFHFFEALWMLAGRADVAWPARFTKNIENYSDDGVTLHGAYGKRWRHHFNTRLTIDQDPHQYLDQLRWAVERLRSDPNDRRVVISMWDPYVDPGWAEFGGKDVPCNTHMYPSVSVRAELDLTVCCRSNDMIWGAYGANAVHFSFLQEWLARRVGVPVGRLYQVSNNFHAYLDTLEKVKELGSAFVTATPYERGDGLKVEPIIQISPERWDAELEMFMTDPKAIGYTERFFRQTAVPMLAAHDAFKSEGSLIHRCSEAMGIADRIVAQDWRRACMDWLERRAAGGRRV